MLCYWGCVLREVGPLAGAACGIRGLVVVVC